VTDVLVSLDRAMPCGLVAGNPWRRHLWSNFDFTASNPKALAEEYLENGFVPLKDGFRKRACVDCDLCVPVRIDLENFDEQVTDSKKLRSERKHILRHNDDLETFFRNDLPPIGIFTDGGLALSPHVQLLEKYTHARFPLKKKFNAAVEVQSMNYPGFDPVSLDLVAPQNFLAGVSIAHIAHHSAYATKIFFDPSLTKQGMGLYLMLETIRLLKDQNLKYLYIAEWTKSTSSLSWKDKLTPFEIYIDDEWIRYDHRDIRIIRDHRHDIYPGLGQ